jgi:hypothetical protein
VNDMAAAASRIVPPAATTCSNTVVDTGFSSANSSGPDVAAAPSAHSNASAEAPVAPEVATPGTRPCAELLASGLAAMHELLGRYRWCSQQYLQGQVCASGWLVYPLQVARCIVA